MSHPKLSTPMTRVSMAAAAALACLLLLQAMTRLAAPGRDQWTAAAAARQAHGKAGQKAGPLVQAAVLAAADAEGRNGSAVH